jgi:translation initiation factor IF-2
MLEPVYQEVIIGQAEIREIYKVSKIGTIGGCMVTDGKLRSGCSVRLIREGVVIYTGKLGSLRRFKDDVREVQNGYECGITIENYNDIKVGDLIEAYEEQQVAPEV